MDIEKTKQNIVSFIREIVGSRPAVIGLSGGVDSSTVAYLAKEALGGEKIHAILSPSSSNASEDERLGKLVADNLNIQYEVIDIDAIVNAFQISSNFYGGQKTLGNLKARVRMCLLYGYADKCEDVHGQKGAVLGTGNKSEIMTGYTTKHGDAACDLLPIGDLYKTEVRTLAHYLGVPEEIMKRHPTAGLWDGQFDEDELGISYQTLDSILKAIEQHANLSLLKQSDVELVKKYIELSKHKRQLPPICEITS